MAREHDNGSNGGVRRTVVVAVVHGPKGEQEEEGGEAELTMRLRKSLDGFVAAGDVKDDGGHRRQKRQR